MEVYIILTDTGTLFTKMIRRFTKYPLNHASISFTKELDTTYSFGRKRANNPFIGGFVKEDMNGKLFRKAKCAVYKCSVSEFEYKQMLNGVRQIEVEKQAYKYNFIGLFGVLLNKKINRKKAFFCSEFVATILNSGGIAISSKHPSLVKPNDLANCEKFSLIYEGQLFSYLSPQGTSMNNEREVTASFLEKAKYIVGYKFIGGSF
ncbi:hypothetical protein ACFFHH_02620 [Cytobacillus solani]|uniref:hypothetical protein n=1 Tax=Cytobacillus solani TaxID=1637975 RepID=UPI0009494E4C|nr:hypothetical protein [Cytobacillus solani]USK55408.1 hypothetical protein LIS82_02320 [Cytobacillus solani]